MPKKEVWKDWDNTCLHPHRSCIPGLKQDCEDSKIFSQYFDEDGLYKSISKTTHINTLNAMYLLVLQHWPSLVHVLNQLLVASVDSISLPFLIPECVDTPDTIRSMYFGGINYHNHNSEYIVMMKVQGFQKRGFHQANINEPPETVLQKLRLASQEINAMAINQDAEPISPTMLRMKFMEIMQDIPQYKHAIGILNLQAKEDINGNPVPPSLDEYTKKLQIIFLESKESSFRQRVNLVEEEHTNVAYNKDKKSSNPKYPSPFSTIKDSSSKTPLFQGAKDFSKSKQKPTSSFGISASTTKKPVCFSFRDRGTCSYGKDCKFLHEKSSGAFTLATQEELDVQCGANAVYQYKMRKFASKQGNAKKMSNHRDKIKSSNTRKHSAHLSEIKEADAVMEESKEEEEEQEELHSAEVDQPSEDPFEFSSDSDSHEDL